MFNPFALEGGYFLLFYFILGLLVLGAQRVWSRAVELAAIFPQLDMTDPYQIAYLRVGRGLALDIVAVSLIDRGLLSSGEETLLAEKNADSLVRRPIEKAVLRLYRSAGRVSDMRSDSSCLAACQKYQDVLEQHGLLTSPSVSRKRVIPLLTALAVLAFVGVLKLEEGISEVAFLVLLMIGFIVSSIKIFRRRRTALGDAMMADLRILFARLRDRSSSLRQGGATNEAALLAAMYGIDELPPLRFPGLGALRYRRKKDSSCGGGGGGCGGSCSSCGGGCGGGCGG